ncbi:MAG: dicarboxylate/amino acid:cation symporter [Synergistaceae bacterium]|nr:dicarboxylate/amino acid:cation symporter [Synergistaceae bacterium]
MQKKFDVTGKADDCGLAEALGFIREQLGAMKLKTKDSLRTELMCEETLLTLINHSDFSGTGYLRVNIRKVFGDVIIDLAVPGNEFEFLSPADVSVLKSNDDILNSYGAIRRLVLRPFTHYMSYRHSGDFNTVSIKAVQSYYSGLYRTLTALFLAVASGLALRSFAPESVCMAVNNNILVPVRTVFLNGLGMCAVPIVFCSVMSCVADMGGLSGIKKTCGTLFKYFVICKIIGLIVGLCSIYIFRPGTGVNIPLTSGETVNVKSVSLIGMFTDLVAGNIFRPFLEGNMLQLIVLAFMAGFAVSVTDAKCVRKFSGEVDMIFMKIMGFFLKFIVPVMFCSAASMIIVTGTGTLSSLAGIICTVIGGHIVTAIALCFLVKFSAKLSPLTMLRKSAPMLITAFSTCTSTAAIPDGLKSCAAMGISPSLYSFSIPLATSVNKVYSAAYYVTIVISASNLYGINIPPVSIIMLILMSSLMSIATPSIFGAGLITLSVLFSEFGCPVEFIGIVVPIDILTDFTATVLVCLGHIVCTLLAASSGNLIDREQYNRP